MSCVYQGLRDVTRHCNSTAHKNFAKGLVNQLKINMRPPSSNRDDSVVRAETLMKNFFGQYNLPFALSDHLTKLFPKILTDSKMARKYACARSKTTCIINDAMMPLLDRYISDYMSDIANKYSFINGGSSGTSFKK